MANEKEVKFGFTTSEQTAKAKTDGTLVLVKPETTGAVGKIFFDGNQYGGGGSGDSEKMPEGSSTAAWNPVAVGTSVSEKTALDILKMMLFPTYVPKYATASCAASVVYTVKNGVTTLASDYMIALASGVTLDVTADIRIAGTKAVAKASTAANGSKVAFTAYGGALSSIKKSGTAITTGLDANLADGISKSVTIDSVGAFNTDVFLTLADAVFASGTDVVKNSAGEATNIVASEFGKTAGSASSDIDATSKTIIQLTKQPSQTSFRKTLYGYLPIFYQSAMAIDGTPSSSVPSGAAPAGSSSTILAMTVSNNTVSNSTQVAANYAYAAEVSGLYFKMKMPVSNTTTPWQILLPDGYKIDSFYILGIDGVSWNSTTTAMLSKTTKSYELFGRTYYMWEGALNASAQPVAFRITKV